MQAWNTILSHVTDNSQVATDVELALTDPAAYIAANADDLYERGIEPGDDVPVVIALIDGLMAHNELVYVDWKEEAFEVVAGVAELPRVAALGVDLDEVEDALEPGQAVDVALQKLNEFLNPKGVAVVVIDEDSDAYAIAAVAVDSVPALTEAGSEVGVHIAMTAPM